MIRRCLALFVLAVSVSVGRGQSIEFNRDVRPILSNNCFLCHGPDKAGRKADLRLDLPDGLHEDRGDGTKILVPGKPSESALYTRMISHDPAKKMPPAKMNKTVTAKELATIKKWIEEGAEHQKHWSFISPARVAAPKVRNESWVRNPVDRFILSRLEAENLKPSPEADRRTLLRRLSFDLTGLPPTSDEVDAFLSDASPDAYEKQVDRLLNSKRFGERMALYWLDLVRFADTGGYHSDNHRDIAPYRDWVISAFNDNLPYDRFTVEQLAGDLLPGATPEQRIASGYNRLLQTTEEGGAQPKEYQAKYFADRVRNVSTVWLGLTLGCTECHNHPYDPFTTKEFYQLGAFFVDINEKAVGRQQQTSVPTLEQEAKLKSLVAEIGRLQNELTKKGLDERIEKWQASVLDQKLKGVSKEIAAIVNVPPAKRDAKQKQALSDFVCSQDPELKPIHDRLNATRSAKSALERSIPETLVSMSTNPRTVRVLRRGNWLDDSGEIVSPGTPASLPKLNAANAVKGWSTRLDLARWLVAPENPLTARVFVNRLWMLAFGQGLSKSLDDLGSQGAWPSHPELLDWLALEFQEKGWDVKAMLRTIVTSSAYRQSSVGTPESRQRDPFNALVARQGRFRLEAEMIRDNALSISGLLVEKIGGPSVRPYQPAGYLQYLNFPKRDWKHDQGENQHRRGIYTYWQRTFLHPSLLAFDAPTREECTVERPRSNTPQQALVLLNDPTYVEASRTLAEKLLRIGDDSGRVEAAFRAVLQRDPSPEERSVVLRLLEKQREHYEANVKDAEALIRIGERPVSPGVSASDLAAWTNVARAVLNMHEAITRN